MFIFCLLTIVIRVIRASVSGLWPFLSCGFSMKYIHSLFCLQCFDAVGWAAGRASGL